MALMRNGSNVWSSLYPHLISLTVNAFFFSSYVKTPKACMAATGLILHSFLCFYFNTFLVQLIKPHLDYNVLNAFIHTLKSLHTALLKDSRIIQHKLSCNPTLQPPLPNGFIYFCNSSIQILLCYIFYECYSTTWRSKCWFKAFTMPGLHFW